MVTVTKSDRAVGKVKQGDFEEYEGMNERDEEQDATETANKLKIENPFPGPPM